MVFGRKKRQAQRHSDALQENIGTQFTALQNIETALGGLNVEHELLEEIADFLQTSDQRRLRWGNHTIAALLGGSGSGKSALFNRLSGQETRKVSVQRPTSTNLGAALWLTESQSQVSDNTQQILDYLQISERIIATQDGPAGLVLVDTPDLDSIATEHWELARQLADAADVLIWVVDPQKYADEQLHHRFIADYAHLAPVTLVVLNQADLLSSSEQSEVKNHLEQILIASGFDEQDMPEILLTSAHTGQGIEIFMATLAELCARHEAVYERMEADARNLGDLIVEEFPVPTHIHPPEVTEELVQDVAHAGGIENISAIHARFLRKEYRLLPRRVARRGTSSSKSASEAAYEAAHGKVAQTQVDEHQERRMRRILQEWFRPWAASVGERWAPILENHVNLPQLAENTSSQLGAWWSLSGMLAPRPVGARLLRLLRWAGIGAVAVGLIWLLLDVLGPVIHVYLGDPPLVTIGSIGEFGLPIVILVGGILWWLLWSVINSGVRAFAASWHKRRLIREVEGKLNAVLAEYLSHTLDVRLHTLGQYRNAVLELMGKAH